MPFDPSRLQPVSRALADAETAYARALGHHTAAAERLAAAPSDESAHAAERSAAAAVDVARRNLASSRRALDEARLAELGRLGDDADVIAQVDGRQVLGLLPVSLEAKLKAGELRLRVWPDVLATPTHDARLQPAELEAGQRYWKAERAAATDADRLRAWSALAEVVGITRAAWVAQALTPTSPPGAPLTFPAVPLYDSDAPFVARAILPDRFVAVGVQNGEVVFTRTGAPIPTDLAVGFDTTPSESATLNNAEGEPIKLPPRMRWLTNFAEAERSGMAMTIRLRPSVSHLDYVLVFGLRLTQTPGDGASTMERLLTEHRFSRGLAFVPQDTPTNHSDVGGSGLPSTADRVEESFRRERNPRTLPAQLAANGNVVARALGIDAALLAAIPGAGSSPTVAGEPEGFEVEMARAVQTVLWQVTIGAAVEDFFGADAKRGDALRDYFREFVRAAGPLPAIRVGRQPYGLLPVTALAKHRPAPGEHLDPRLLSVLDAARTWWRQLRSGQVYEGTPEEALRQLGRSTRLLAETTPQNPNVRGHNRWTTLLGALRAAGSADLAADWRTPPMLATSDQAPQPISLPTLDETTGGALAALAAATPDAIAAAPLPSSLFARMARQSALLEWARFARAVSEAAFDAPTRQRLAREAATAGIHVYTDALLTALALTRRDLVSIAPRLVADRVDGRTDGRIVVRPPAAEGISPEEKKQVAALIGDLSQPLASCPGAARLSSFREALALLAGMPLPRLEPVLFGALDVCNQRLDAWITSLATRRLATQRQQSPRGIVLGAWGCLQDVALASTDPLREPEYLHAPSLDQAAAAAVLRSAALRAGAEGSAHADIDLSSKRVRTARWLLDGIRNGASLSEMLGLRFERRLAGTPAEAHLDGLRATFRSTRGIVDGLALQYEGLSRHPGLPSRGTPAGDALHGAATEIDEAIDALADALTAEATYQLVKGNPGAALINLQKIASGEVPPPPLRFTETPASANRITHRLAVLVPAGVAAPGWEARTPRAEAEPLLETWCGHLLGRADEVVLTVDGATESGPEVVQVALSTLGAGALDVVLAGRDGGDELGDRVVRAARIARPALTGGAVRRDRAWKDLVGLAGAVARLLRESEPLSPSSLTVPGAETEPTGEGDFGARAVAAQAKLVAVRDALARQEVAAVPAAADFGVRIPGTLTGTPDPALFGALEAAVGARLASAAAVENGRDKLRALFGGDLPGLAAFMVPAGTLTTAADPPEHRLGVDPLLPSAWLDAMGQIRSAAARFGEVVQRLEVGGRKGAEWLRVAQSPFQEGDHWIGAAFSADRSERPIGRVSILMHAPAGVDETRPAGGLLLDAWSESVPLLESDTAMALRYNSPSTRAPHLLLLAVPPDPARGWSTPILQEMLRDTLELARLRMQPATTASRSGHLPLIWLGQRLDGSGISFSL